MARSTAIQSSSSMRVDRANKAGPSRPKARDRSPSPDDSLLETDDEEDEFAEGFTDIDRGREDEGEDIQSGEEEEEEGEGVGMYEADDWDGEDDEGSESGSEDQSAEDDEKAQMRRLQADLTSLPLSTLLKAQKSIKPRSAPSDSDSDSDSGPSNAKLDRVAEVKARLAEMQKRKGKAFGVSVEGESKREAREKEEKEVARLKRESKHAPTAISSKRQVTRMRQVVDVPKLDRRDPRFASLSAGQIDPHLHSQSYAFLPSLLKTELSSLRQALKAAQKLEITCPLYEKPLRTSEREGIELELGRLRTKIERDEREGREREVLGKIKKEEREKREGGKGAWYMKKGEKRDVLLKAKFEDLQKKGGQKAVKKAVEKKRKKVAGKEKKSRPFARGQGEGAGAGEDGVKRRRVG